MNNDANINTHSAYGKVAVLMGGVSAEREISLQTGRAVLDALLRQGIDAHAIDVDQKVTSTLAANNFDRAFIALHGRGGEDGIMQGALDTLGIPYTGSGVLGSALAMDKTRSKWLWQQHGLATPDFIEISSEQDLLSASDSIGLPMMIKPVQEGSSCGAAKVADGNELRRAWLAASRFDTRVMAERWIAGKEYTVGILAGQALPVIRLQTPRTFYDYEAKYLEDTTAYVCPCGLAAQEEKALAAMALKAFALLGASGWGRVDLMQDASGKTWLIEVNTIPGMTSHSLVPMAALQAGIEFDELVVRILDTSIEKPASEKRRLV